MSVPRMTRLMSRPEADETDEADETVRCCRNSKPTWQLPTLPYLTIFSVTNPSFPSFPVSGVQTTANRPTIYILHPISYILHALHPTSYNLQPTTPGKLRVIVTNRFQPARCPKGAWAWACIWTGSPRKAVRHSRVEIIMMAKQAIIRITDHGLRIEHDGHILVPSLLLLGLAECRTVWTDSGTEFDWRQIMAVTTQDSY